MRRCRKGARETGCRLLEKKSKGKKEKITLIGGEGNSRKKEEGATRSKK